jgi:hypothetical protein
VILFSFGCKKAENINLKAENISVATIENPSTFEEKLSNAAISIIDENVVYTPDYVSLKYPNGDVPTKTGVCSDVVIRAYRKLGIDLQKEVHEDMVANFTKYPNLKKQSLAVFSFGLTAQSVKYSQNKFTRDYLAATRIIWQSDTTGKYIVNSEKLLEAGNGQADLVGANLCEIKGGGKVNSAILLDFGKEIHGGIQVVAGMHPENRPIRVKITLGESVSEAMSEVDRSTATNDHAIREFEILVPWLGVIEIGNSGFRFAKIELLDQKRVLKLKEVRAIAVQRDIPWLGSFKSSDERLNQIWQTGAYTVYLNMQEFLWDGIKRDRLVWVGDMHPEVMTILSVFGYNEVVPKSLDMIRDITKLPAYMNGISSYSMWWVLIHYQWYLNNGDLAYLQENQEYIYSLLNLLEKKIDTDGKENLDGNRFLDWPTSPKQNCCQ